MSVQRAGELAESETTLDEVYSCLTRRLTPSRRQHRYDQEISKFPL